MSDQSRYDSSYDPDNFIAAHDLAIAIEKLIDNCKDHLGYIERALDTAQQYARALRSVTVPLKLHHEGWGYIGRADADMDSFAIATEVALNLRRAGDVSLNDHYG